MWVKTYKQHAYCLPVLEAGPPSSRCQKGWIPRGCPSWLVDTTFPLSSRDRPSESGCDLITSSYKGHLSCWTRAPLTRPYSSLVTSFKSHVQMQPHPKAPGVRLHHVRSGAMTQPITDGVTQSRPRELRLFPWGDSQRFRQAAEGPLPVCGGSVTVGWGREGEKVSKMML